MVTVQRDEVRVSHEETWVRLRNQLVGLSAAIDGLKFSMDHDADYLVAGELEEFLLHAEERTVPLARELFEVCARRPRV